jgi:hypothetical protein
MPGRSRSSYFLGGRDSAAIEPVGERRLGHAEHVARRADRAVLADACEAPDGAAQLGHVAGQLAPS